MRAKEETVKARLQWLTGLGAAVLLALGTGCLSVKAVQQKENLLIAAGFKAIPAISPEQQQLMNSLPTDRISAISRMGKVYFVYPDPFRQVLYVGRDAEYLAYEQRAQTQGLESGAWEAAWGDWDGQ